MDPSAAVRRLLDAAHEASATNDRAIRTAVRNVIDAFEAPSTTKNTRAMRLLAAGTSSARGGAAHVLHLTLGAIVEGGGDPMVAWPAVEAGLTDVLGRASRFARACLIAAQTDHLEEALETAGANVAESHPRDAAAWKSMPSRCLAAVACLTRSRSLRRKVRENGKIKKAAAPLADAVAEVAFLVQVVEILDDEPLVVLHPQHRAGFRVVTRDVATNAELLVLLADALIGSSKKGLLPGSRPSARAIAMVKNEAGGKGKPAVVTPPWDLLAWDEGATDPREHHHGLSLDGIPADIPRLRKERVVVLREPDHAHALELEPTFVALRPALRVAERLEADEVARFLDQVEGGRAPAARAPRPRRPTRGKPRGRKPRAS